MICWLKDAGMAVGSQIVQWWKHRTAPSQVHLDAASTSDLGSAPINVHGKQMASRLWIPNHDTTHWPLTEQIIPSCVVCNSSVSSGPWIHTLYGKEPIYLSSQPNELCDFLVLLHKSFKIKGGHVHHICKCYHSQLQLPFNSHATSHPRIVEVCALASDVKQSERSPKPEDSQRFQTISFCISKFPKVSWVRLYHPISRSLWLIFGGEYVTFTKADP